MRATATDSMNRHRTQARVEYELEIVLPQSGQGSSFVISPTATLHTSVYILVTRTSTPFAPQKQAKTCRRRSSSHS